VKEEAKPGQVILNVKLANVSFPAWENLVKRLESFGDLDLATWGHRIKRYYAIRPNLMKKYFEVMSSQDPKVLGNVQKIKMKAVLASREIESKYQFRKVLTFTTYETTEILSISYSEGLLKGMGYTLDGFSSYSQNNGIPSLFEDDSQIQLDMARYFIDCSTIKTGNAVDERPEFKTFMIDKNGKKKEVVAQYIYVLDPTPEGFFLMGYLVIKSEDAYGNPLYQKTHESSLGLKIYKYSNKIDEKIAIEPEKSLLELIKSPEEEKGM